MTMTKRDHEEFLKDRLLRLILAKLKTGLSKLSDEELYSLLPKNPDICTTVVEEVTKVAKELLLDLKDLREKPRLAVRCNTSLKDLRGGAFKHHLFDIRAHIGLTVANRALTLHEGAKETVLFQVFGSWPEFSGLYESPITQPNHKDNWSGAYGLKQMALLDFTIEELEQVV